MKIYVASSWRCLYQPDAVKALRDCQFDVYDFRRPAPDDEGFHWSEIDSDWRAWTVEQFERSLDNPIARRGFRSDRTAMETSDACVLVLPCGRSAHLEAGWFVGQGKPVYVWSPEPCEPELMYKFFDGISSSIGDVVRWAIAKDTARTCHHPGCLKPYDLKPPCALCYE